MACILGLTGSFGSGKSAVSALFRELGAAVIDADELARQVVEPGSPALAEIAETFGPDLIGPDGRLARRELAGRVFGDPQAVARLNAIIHPRVRGETLRLLGEWKDAPLIVLDVPLLFEAGMQSLADKVAVVVISENQRFYRLRHRGFSEREVIQRLGAQMPQADKIRQADFIIDNSGTIEATRKQVQTLMDQLSREKQ
jgi:dephospho-CoA kinase